MPVIEASLPGTLRTILWLLAAWWIIRLILRLTSRRGPSSGARPTNEVPRPKGEVRIEKVPPRDHDTTDTNGTITDADFEEIK